jgi:ABC-type oligopeptide transport system substrate-binding subunit
MSNLDYDICRSTWLGDVLDPINFLECFLTGGGNNRAGYTSPEFDALIQQAYAEPDSAKRSALMQQAEARLLEDAPFAPMLFMTQKFLRRADIAGADTNLLGYLPLAGLFAREVRRAVISCKLSA